jgi:hypothetical protein
MNPEVVMSGSHHEFGYGSNNVSHGVDASYTSSSYLEGNSFQTNSPDHQLIHQEEPQASTSREVPAPTYDDIFPALPESDDLSVQDNHVSSGCGFNDTVGNNGNHSKGATYAGNASNKSSASNQSMKLKSSNLVRMYRVNSNQVRGDKSKACADIMSKTHTSIEITTGKDVVTFTIRGKEDAVNSAISMIGQQLQTQSTQEISVKKELHKFILGKAGKRLLELQDATGTKISVPKADSQSDLIKIVGLPEGIQKVVHDITSLCQDLGARASERINVEVCLFPFVRLYI